MMIIVVTNQSGGLDIVYDMSKDARLMGNFPSLPPRSPQWATVPVRSRQMSKFSSRLFPSPISICRPTSLKILLKILYYPLILFLNYYMGF